MTGGIGPVGVVDQAEVDDLDARSPKFLGYARQLAFKAFLETGKLRPIGIQADAEKTDAKL